MKIYKGVRHQTEIEVQMDGQPFLPDESLKLRNHSPNGFEWGYGGSGPAQLALAVLLDCKGKEIALARYQQFKWAVIAGMGDFWILTEDDVNSWLTLTVEEEFEGGAPTRA